MYVVQQSIPDPVRLTRLLIFDLAGVEVHEVEVLGARLLRLEVAFAPSVSG